MKIRPFIKAIIDMGGSVYSFPKGTTITPDEAEYIKNAPRMIEMKLVNKDEAIRYLLPALKVLSELNVKYEVGESQITIKIPKFIPN